MKLSSLIALFLIANSVLSQDRILIDDDFSDWQNIPPAHIDPSGDNGFSTIDFRKLWVSNDAENLYLNIEVGFETNLQESNEVTIYIDTDNDETTGFSINEIGADLSYNFGNRNGMIYTQNNSLQVYHDDIQLISSPTVSSDQFEIAINRNLEFFGQELFQGDTIQIVFKDNGGNFDMLPDGAGGVAFTYVDESPDPLPQYAIQKTNPEFLRVLSYNVLSDGLFDFAREPSMSRLIQAIGPDLIGFQEIYDHGSFEVANKIESILPSGTNEQWYHAKEGPDIIAISKYPIISSFPIDNNGAFLLDLGNGDGAELLFIVAHTPCCGNNIDRQQEIDAIMSFVRNAKAGIGPLSLVENTPIIIVGDMNLVGYQQQLVTLLTGDIVYENLYGPGFSPDWDDSDLEDSRPYVTGLPMNFTWFNEGSSFSPGRLDFTVYSGSVLELSNNFALFSRTLPQDTLDLYNLMQEDAVIASDHLPVVSDFVLDQVTGFKNITANDFLLQQNEPNPFDQTTTITYYLSKKSQVNLSIYDMNGKKITNLVDEYQNSGSHSFEFDAVNLNAGIYFIKITAGAFTDTKKMVLIKT